MSTRKTFAAFVALLIAAAAHGNESKDRNPLRPSAVFAQAGVAEHAHTLSAGATWEWRWKRQFRSGAASGYWEASLGRWASDREAGNTTAWVTQLGITPIFRLQPSSWNPGWFVEGGIGVNLLMPIYENRDKRFSTTFNFGDHLAVGRSFGASGRHEIALRLQHFSNAGIRHPNPGEDFLQVRWSVRL